MITRLVSSFVVLLSLGVFGCKTTNDSALKDATGASDPLAGKSYCQMAPLANGQQTKACYHFEGNNSGSGQSVVNGALKNVNFYYSVSGNKVSIAIPESPLVTYTMEMTLSTDGRTLTAVNGGRTYVWTLENQTTTSLAGKKYCAVDPGTGDKGCLKFNDGSVGVSEYVSGDARRTQQFSYFVSGNSVTMMVVISPLETQVGELILSADGRTLTKKGPDSFTWTLE